jgi:hypothetical protein
MDEVDMANERLEIERAALIARHRLHAARIPLLYARCRNCDETLDVARRAAGFCSAECRDDFQRLEAAQARRGQPANS